MQLSDHEKVKILMYALKQYASLLNWSKCDNKSTYIDKWYGDGNGYDTAKKTLDFLKKYEKIENHDIISD